MGTNETFTAHDKYFYNAIIHENSAIESGVQNSTQSVISLKERGNTGIYKRIFTSH